MNIKPRNRPFYESLHGRGLNLKALAGLIGSSYTHVVEVLNNKPGHGQWTRKRLAKHLTDAELAMLGWDRCGRRVGTSKEIMEAMYQGSTGNEIGSLPEPAPKPVQTCGQTE